ncbi:MAG: ABC transporter permease [Candidatus Izimaplasma sp.]|nr:ABC transporter permease [Candidatus Izimaplasma bacterium]
MTVFRFEVKKLWLSTVFWSIGIFSALLLYMAFFPTMAADPTAMETIMQNFPEEFLHFFGLSSALTFNSILGYYAMTIGFIMGAIAVHGAYLGLSILSVEERELTADFLMTRPISRQQIFVQKVLAVVIHIVIIYIVINVASIITVTIFRSSQTVDYQTLLIFTSSLIFFQLFFVSLGLCVSLLIPKFDNVITYALALGFGLFILSGFGDMLSIELTTYLTPFGYFDPNIVLVEGLSLQLFILNLIWIIGTLFLSYKLYLSRNIHTI